MSAVQQMLVAGGGGDPYYANVSLLLHCDGVNGSTTFTDNSPSPKTVTANGNAQITTTDPKFGSGSVTFDGTGDYLNTASDNAFNFPSVPFTVECWFNSPNASPFDFSNTGIFSQRISGVYAPFEIRLYRGGISWLIANASINSWAYSSNSTINIVSQNTWYHIAFVGTGTNLTLYFNGTSIFTNTQPAWTSANRTMYIGSGGDGAFTGKIDEFRVTKGVARYTANFAPPTMPFPSY